MLWAVSLDNSKQRYTVWRKPDDLLITNQEKEKAKNPVKYCTHLESACNNLKVFANFRSFFALNKHSVLSKIVFNMKLK